MRVIRAEQAADAGNDTMDTFSGTAHIRALNQWSTAAEDKLSAVSFEPGGRTHWHEHEHGQLLIVTAGGGFVAVAGDDPVPVAAGDLVIADAGERHWHGAGPDGPLTHLAVSRGHTSWFGPVEEEPG